MPGRNLTVIDTDQPRPLRNKNKAPGRAVVNVFGNLEAVISPGRSERMPVINDAGMILPACTA